jgi:hypothetical protein
VAIYVVGYDIHPQKGETYESLIKALQTIGDDWWHCLDSTWLIKTPMSALDLTNAIWKHMRADDQLLVVKYDPPHSAWNGFKDDCNDWLKRNM